VTIQSSIVFKILSSVSNIGHGIPHYALMWYNNSGAGNFFSK